MSRREDYSEMAYQISFLRTQVLVLSSRLYDLEKYLGIKWAEVPPYSEYRKVDKEGDNGAS